MVIHGFIVIIIIAIVIITFIIIIIIAKAKLGKFWPDLIHG